LVTNLLNTTSEPRLIEERMLGAVASEPIFTYSVKETGYVPPAKALRTMLSAAILALASMTLFL